jgi:GT2 family glycosyltransferase
VLDPLVSVVVSTHERPDRLSRLLAGLRSQSLAPEAVEVVIVDDGSGPATRALLDEAQEAGDLRLRRLRNPAPLGPGGGRNRGWRAAQAPLVAFTDDDCVPEPGWLRSLVEASAEHPEAILQGRTIPDPDELPAGNRLLTRTVSVERLGPQYETCNIAYPRSLLASLGGFDESYGLKPSGEDTDLAWRGLERGRVAVFVPKAVVRHAVVRLSLTEALRDGIRWAQCARLFARHPATRQMLHRGVFWNVWHYLLIRSMLALLAPPALRRLLLRRHLDALRARARAAGAGPAWLPFLIAYDVIETTAMVRSAARHRTPVL